MNIPRWRAALLLGLTGGFAFFACTSAPGTQALGSGGGIAAAGAVGVAGSAGQVGGAAGTAGTATSLAGAGGAIVGGASGMSGVSGASAGTSGAAGSSGSGGSGGSGGSSGSGGSGGATVCPGAGKSLRFQDDLNGMSTKSTQLTADLGADLPIGDTARTVEMWVYMEGKESWKAEHSIVEYGGTGRCQAFGIDGGDNQNNDPAQFDPFTFSAGGPCSGDDNVSIVPAPPRTGWLHLAWVYDPTGKLAYLGTTNSNFLFTVNGVPQPIPAKTQTGHLLTMKTLVVIGAGQGTDNGLTGKMDEFRFWNVARTPTEIADNYQVILKGDEPGLVAYYHFDDGVGTTVKDSSSKQHDAMFDTSNNRPVPTWVTSDGLTLTCAP
jgi:hypothetical protein